MKSTTILGALVILPALGMADAKLASKEVLLDNDQVEVVRGTYPVGSESGMHTHVHPNRIVYFIRGGTLEIVPQDPSKPPQRITAADGKTLFLPAATHNVKNVGDSLVILLESEIKAN